MRRLVFGEVAELYERSRPSYPAALIDDVLALAPLDGRRAVEVGAGTGKATRLFAARGVAVVAIEPSAEMAAVARRTTAEWPGVQVVQADFEDWRPADERFGLVFSAQAWHWVDPEQGFTRARAALIDGGLLAAFWNRPTWVGSPLRDELSAVYRTTAPQMTSDGPLHPDNEPDFDEADWERDIAAAEGLKRAEVRRYDGTARYTAGEYVDLLATLSEVRLLEEATREALRTAVGLVIERHGGTVSLPMTTSLCLAWAG